MQARHGRRRRTKRQRILFAGGFSALMLALTGAGIFALLSAQATGSTSTSSGTLLLTLSGDGGSSGFGNTTPVMAPGDVDNIYVNMNNTGTLASAAGMTLQVGGSPANLLTTSATKGLAVTITQCSVTWTSGSCSGTTTPILASTPVANLSSATALSNVPALAASGSLAHLQVSLALPNQNETSVNGTLPNPTIQGLSTQLTYTFTETQRAPATTNQ
jgi:spore coat-associated protein N